ncbi:MAG: glycosyltransferase family 2 protein [Acidobacteriota bacterium]
MSELPPPGLSVVIPIHNEEEVLPLLWERLRHVLGALGIDWEVVFVDDGSTDQSAAVLHRWHQDGAPVAIVELARRFGQQAAISAGLSHARGAMVAVMDGDLQDPPELLAAFVTEFRAGHDVVYAVRAERREAWHRRLAYAIYYRLLRLVAQVDIPLDAGDFCLMSRRVVDVLVSMPERNRFIRGIRSWVGFSQVGVLYERPPRVHGTTKYSFAQLLYLALDGLIAFSVMPLRIITLLGLSVSVVSIGVALFYLVKKLTSGIGLPGFTTLAVALFFLAGVQLITIGVIGEYVGRIAEEVKQRPLYVTRRVTKRSACSES